MSDEIKPVKSERLAGVDVTPDTCRDKSIVGPGFKRSPELAKQIRGLSNLGISKNAIANFLGISTQKIEEDYAKDLIEGKHDMNVKLATLAMQAAEAGDSKMIQYLCKVKLGWTETSTIEHVGEVRAVVSAKPLTKDEFEKKYIASEDEESGEE
jgi:hypothetical protein